MKKKTRIVILPGLGNSADGHWQSRWEKGHSRIKRIPQKDWKLPDREAWVGSVLQEIEQIVEPVVIAAHGIGCQVAVHYAPFAPENVRGLILVAPTDPEQPSVADLYKGFSPVPMEKLKMKSYLVYSTNDPFCTPERARRFADAWGANVHELGDAGHINERSGFGPWPEGLYLLSEMLKIA